MAIVSGTYTTFSSVGQREDLTDILSNISRTDRPFMSMIGRGSAKATFSEWQTDTLADAADNAQIEGDEASFTTPTATQRLGNRTQISRKTLIVSETDDVVEKAGRGTDSGYLVAKYGEELLRDIERAMCGKNGIVTGNSTTARVAAGFETWVTTNVSSGTSYANVAKTNGQPNAGATLTDGTQRVFLESQLQAVCQGCYEQGGQPTQMIVGSFNKVQASGFTGNATRVIQASGNRLDSAISVYAHDFGELTISPSIFSRSRTAMVIDPRYWDLLYLRPIKRKELAVTGDAEKAMLIAEWTLRARQEASSGKVADLTTS